jgi:hypothetical protein
VGRARGAWPGGPGARQRQVAAFRDRSRDFGRWQCETTGQVWTWTVEPDPAGATLSLTFEWSAKVPLMDKVVDLFAWNGDRDLDIRLGRWAGSW